MTLKINKVIKIFVLLLIFTLAFTVTSVSAQVPYDSYTYWSGVSSDKREVYNRTMFEPELLVDAEYMGTNSFVNINDVCSDDNGQVYLLDSNSRIVVLDNSYKSINEIGTVGGERYDNANSIFVHSDGTIYICDTENHRVLHITDKGDLINVIGIPDSPIIPEKFDFRPTAMQIDSNGYIYILSDGSYYGALLFSPNNEFLGFYGANTVEASIGSVLKNIKNRVFPNNVKKGNTASELPFCFVDLAVDKDGFVYTCTGYTDKDKNKGQIRMLSPGTGSNVLGSEAENFVDTRINTSDLDGAFEKQDILKIEIDDSGFIYGLESSHGKVFMYDSNCRTITVFGGGMGSGTQKGTFSTVSGMALCNDGSTVMVSDSETNLLTVFKLNDFGKRVKDCVALTVKGYYDEAKAGWEKIITEDNNFQPAYSGLSRAYLGEGDYKTSMEYAKIGYDRETYAIAFEYMRTDFINNNFVLLFIICLVIVIGIVALLFISTKRKIVFIKNQPLRLMFSTMIHPSNNFTDIEEKDYGSIGLSLFTIAMYYVATVLQSLASGFVFSDYDAETFNSLWVFARSVGFVVLWIVSNWMVCTILGGKGKLKQITIVTSYSLWVLIIEKFIRIILTNVLLPSEASFLGVLDVIAILYFVIMMIIGLLKIHDFGMVRLVGTTILSLIMMAAIFFLLVMCIILFQQAWGFVVTLFSEAVTI